MQVQSNSLLRPLILIGIVSLSAIIFRQTVYLPGFALGILAAWMNHSTLITSLGRQDQRKRLTLRFYWRYLLIGALLFALQWYGQNHLIGFLAGFAVSYASFLTGYLIRLKNSSSVR